MPSDKNIKVLIDGEAVDLDESAASALSISYKFENSENFQAKESSELFNLSIPATQKNNRIAAGMHNPVIEDLTGSQKLRNIRSGIIAANEMELLIGKALCNSVSHTDKPESYDWDFYGNNADWIIPLKEATLYDFLKRISFDYNEAVIMNSWAFDGRNEILPYVFAPVRYTEAIGGRVIDENTNEFIDMNATMMPEYIRPSLSVYWIIYWAFKSIGYRIKSDFFNKNYFRRLVMPWTWGDFRLADEAQVENLDFLAKGSSRASKTYVTYTGPFDCKVDNKTTNGAFDNNGVYTYDPAKAEMKWTYLPAFDYGEIDVTLRFDATLDVFVNGDSHSDLKLFWYKNGAQFDEPTTLKRLVAPLVGKRQFAGMVEDTKTIRVKPNDIISAVTYLDQKDTGLGAARIDCTVNAFELEKYEIPIGGHIDLSAYSKFKEYKFLDFFAGVLDLFDISPQTDPQSKVVLLEPQHDYSLTSSLIAKGGGYYNGSLLNWDHLQDIQKKSILENFSDCERELNFKFKDDSSDGLLKLIQDRNATEISRANYFFPNRFKAGKKKMENRFFSPVVHIDMDQWQGYGTAANLSPQMIALVVENPDSTSAKGSEPVFVPKICYYKGLVDNVGWSFSGSNQPNYPYMFAVNYQPGGHNDPILSYSDELIDGVLGHGLLRRFFLQRLAIMRNGQYYKTFIKLNNNLVSNWFHREYIALKGQKWELNQIKEYRPLSEESTEVYLKKHSPVSEVDSNSVFPSIKSVNGEANLVAKDLKYAKAKALKSDIPNNLSNG